MAISNADLIDALDCAIADFLEEDVYLLERSVNERTITGRLALHLQSALPDFDVDVEYNDNQGVPKRLGMYDAEMVRMDDLEAKTVYPDIIVHERDSANNYLIVEAKKATNKDHARDLAKLRAYTLDSELGYQLGVFLILPVGEGLEDYEPEMHWFLNGKEVSAQHAVQTDD